MGAGIVGASLAYHLARENAHVTLLDKAIRPAADATEKSFGWLRVAPDTSAGYVALRRQAIADWHRVAAELAGRLNMEWSGALDWRASEAETMSIAHSLQNADYSVRLVSQEEVRCLEPNLLEVPALAMWAAQEGATDPGAATALLLQAAQEAGARIQLGHEALALVTNGVGVTGVATRQGKLAADMVVLAAGTNVNALGQPAGLRLPLAASPAILLSFRASRRFVNRIISNPTLEVRAASATQLLAAEDYVDESVAHNPQAIARRTLAEIKRQWQYADGVELEASRVGMRPMPQDGYPIVGRAPHLAGLYVAVAHAGVTLAAVMGRLAAADILHGQLDELLTAYGPARFGK